MSGNTIAGGGFTGLPQVIITVLLIGVASALAHLHVVAQTYYPVVRVQSPEGLVFTAVHEPTSERAACAAVNGEFLAPFKGMCPGCRVVSARCERDLQGVEAALSDGRAIPHHRILAPGVRLAIAGPEEAARVSCDLIARGAGAQPVSCLPPASPPKSS